MRVFQTICLGIIALAALLYVALSVRTELRQQAIENELVRFATQLEAEMKRDQRQRSSPRRVAAAQPSPSYPVLPVPDYRLPEGTLACSVDFIVLRVPSGWEEVKDSAGRRQPCHFR